MTPTEKRCGGCNMWGGDKYPLCLWPKSRRGDYPHCYATYEQLKSTAKINIIGRREKNVSNI